MDRIIATNSVPLSGADTAPSTGTPQYATSGNAATGVLATNLPAYWVNMIQEEIRNVVVAGGVTPEPGTWNQLLAAINALIADAEPTGRTRLTGNTTFYISSSAGSDSNNGLTAGTPWLTRQHAWNTVQNNYDLAGYSVTFQLADGTYTDIFSPQGMMTGQVSPSQVIFNGNSATPTNVIVASSSGTCFNAINAVLQVQNMKVQNSGGNILVAQNRAVIVIGPGMTIGSSSGSKIRASYAGQVLVQNSYTDIGNAQQHYEADSGGQIIVTGGITITESGTPAYSVAYAAVTSLGEILFQNTPSGVATFVGAATGYYYVASVNGIIQTQGSGPTYLPGNAASPTPTTTGGQYA